jgi:putative addiction module component (TIGR02574 family)
MDMAAVLREIDSWPVEVRIQFVQTVWDRIVDTGAEPPLTEGQRAELDRRLAALQADPDEVVTCEEILEQVRRAR